MSTEKQVEKENKKPTMEKYGWQSSNSFEEESGWMFEDGEDAYYEALEKWEIS